MKHILEDNKWHGYAWVYNKGKTILYVDGKPYKGKEGITIDFFGRFGAKTSIGDKLKFIDELRISKCARRIRSK